ncbi:hypothetical protein, partial [Rhodomicrobium sp.]|uniref:hypothetical protein n=1 Tax=Rhodomicrobium sp. TaxID=2720632 RepID=UPI0039E6297C
KMGVADNAVRSRIRSGRLAEAVYDDGSLNEELATRLWKREPPQERKRRLVPPSERKAKIADEANDAAGEFELKLRRMRVALEKETLELEKLKRSTVDREEVRRAARAFGRGHRDQMLNFANRYGPGIAAAAGCDAATLIGLIDARMREALLESVGIPVPFHEPDDPALGGE